MARESSFCVRMKIGKALELTDFFLPGVHTSLEVYKVGETIFLFQALNSDLASNAHFTIENYRYFFLDLGNMLHDFCQGEKVPSNIKVLVFEGFPDIYKLYSFFGIQ